MQTEIAKRSGLKVSSCGGEVFHLKDMRTPQGKEYEVNLAKPDCCDYVHTHKLPCRHMVVVFHKRGLMSSARKVGTTINRFWPKWAHAAEYLKIYERRCVHIPEVRIRARVMGKSF